MAENEKKAKAPAVKAPAKTKKNAPESAETKVETALKAKAVAAKTEPRATAAKTKSDAEPTAAAASSGPQRVPNKPKATPAETPAPAPSYQEIAQLAHRFWKERGGHHGSHEQDWLRAERELRGKAS